MTRTVHGGILLLAAALLRAQTGAAVEGKVVSTADGSAVRKATVLMRASRLLSEAARPERESYVTETDSAGHFRVAAMAPGSYECIVSRSGFEARPPDRPPRNPRITVEEGKEISGLILRLTPLGAVAGRILDMDGQPLAGADVTALQYAFSARGKTLASRGHATSDDRGEFRLYGLYPGMYYLHAVPESEGMTTHYSSFGDAGVNRFRVPMSLTPPIGPVPPAPLPTFYPSAGDIGQARPVAVPAGGEAAGAEIRLQSRGVYSVRGKAPAGTHAGPVIVQKHPFDPNVRNLAGSVRPDGSFEVSGLSPGSYTLRAVQLPEGEKFGHSMASVEVVDRDLDGVQMVFVAAPPVAGAVSVLGKPVSIAGMPVRLQGVEGGGMAVSIRPDGSFAFPPPIPDVYHFGIGLDPSMIPMGIESPSILVHVVSIKLGDAELKDAVLDLRKPVEGKLTVAVSADTGNLVGQVTGEDGKPAAAATVTLIPDTGMWDWQDRYREAEADGDGRFEFDKIVPGRYTVFGWTDIPRDAALDQEFRKPFERLGTPVNVEAQGTRTVDLKLIETEKRR